MNKNVIKSLINKENPIIFEIGCADGIDTQEFLEVFEDKLTIFCFEPDERNINVFTNGGYRECKPSFSQAINGKNVILEKKAVADINGKILFNKSSTIYSSSIKKPTGHLDQWPHIKFEETYETECVTLDNYVFEKNIDIIDFIWADVQGSEDLLIKGGKNTFNNKVRYFYTEYATKQFYENSPNQFEILEMLGSNWEILQDFGTDVLLKNKLFNK